MTFIEWISMTFDAGIVGAQRKEPNDVTDHLVLMAGRFFKLSKDIYQTALDALYRNRGS